MSVRRKLSSKSLGQNFQVFRDLTIKSSHKDYAMKYGSSKNTISSRFQTKLQYFAAEMLQAIFNDPVAKSTPNEVRDISGALQNVNLFNKKQNEMQGLLRWFEFPLTLGLISSRQGSIYWPVLFNLFTNYVILWLTKTFLGNFADDNNLCSTA